MNKNMGSIVSVTNKVLVALVLLGLLLSGMLAGERLAVETRYKNIEVAIHYDALIEESRVSGIAYEELLLQYQKRGATSLFVKESNLHSIANQVRYVSGTHLFWEGLPAQKEWSYIEVPQGDLATRLEYNLSLRDSVRDSFMHGSMVYIGTELPLSYLYALNAAQMQALSGVGMGFPIEDLKKAEDMGYYVQLQIKDWVVEDQAILSRYFSQLDSLHQVSLVMFDSPDLFSTSKQNEPQVVLSYVAEELNKRNWSLGQIEFYEQKGIQTLARLVEERGVRVHTIAQDELSTMSVTAAQERFWLAAKDRNMRSLFIRPYQVSGADAPAFNLNYVGSISQGLTERGFTLGQSATLPNLYVSPSFTLLLSLSVLAAASLWLQGLGFHLLSWVVLVLGLLGSALLLLLDQVLLLQKMLALGTACLFPLWALVHVCAKQEQHDAKKNWWISLQAFLLMTLFSLAGALLIVGLLRERAFMIGLELFSGVKLAHVVPLAGVVLFYLYHQKWEELKLLWRSFLDRPLTMRIVMLTGIAVVILGIYLLRTGNAGMVPSSWEMLLRNTLEHWTSARPRTKEFLIGHPMLLLGLYYGFQARTLPLFVLGMIGQVSIINTFTHLHTPILISVMRVGYGLLLGIMIGLLMIWFSQLMLKRWKR